MWPIIITSPLIQSCVLKTSCVYKSRVVLVCIVILLLLECLYNRYVFLPVSMFTGFWYTFIRGGVIISRFTFNSGSIFIKYRESNVFNT